MGQDVGDKGERVGVLDHDLIQLPIVLYKAEGTILLLDKEHGGSHGGFGWADATVCKILLEEVIKLLLFCRREGECPRVREFNSRCEVYGMVPCLSWGELVEGLLREDIAKVVVWLQYHVLKGLAFLGFLTFLGQSL